VDAPSNLPGKQETLPIVLSQKLHPFMSNSPLGFVSFWEYFCVTARESHQVLLRHILANSMALRLGTATLCRPAWAQEKASSPLVRQTGWISLEVAHPVELGELEKTINSNSCDYYGDEQFYKPSGWVSTVGRHSA
jgi:hypothetical protein